MSQHSRFHDDPGFTVVTVCITCKHATPDGIVCKAFPKGIPSAILNGVDDHTSSVDGDNGIIYEPIELVA